MSMLSRAFDSVVDYCHAVSAIAVTAWVPAPENCYGLSLDFVVGLQTVRSLASDLRVGPTGQH